MIIKKIDETNEKVGEFINKAFTDYAIKCCVELNFEEYCFVAEEGGEIAAILLKAVETEPVMYAVPGHPLVAEQTVQHLIDAERVGEVNVTVFFVESFNSGRVINKCNNHVPIPSLIPLHLSPRTNLQML